MNDRSPDSGSMAEGGQEDDEKNPFSFKKFVSKKDKKKDGVSKSNEEEDFDIFDISQNANQRKRDKQRPVLLVEEDAEEKPKKKTGKAKSENPFSFKKFLSTSSTSKPTPSRNDLSDTGGSSILPNITSDLPDFVQDHFTDSVGSAARGLDLPDFALDQSLSGIREPSSRNNSRTSSFNQRLDNVDMTNESLDNERNVDIQDRVHSQTSSGTMQKLPDFLSDGAYSGNTSPPAVLGESLHTGRPGRDSPFSDRNTDFELKKLQRENQDLRRQLDEDRQRRLSETESIADLQRQIVELKKKEVDETAAMEKAIQQVEQNLTTTTKRAVQAETTVTKLKQEVKSLQAEVKSLRCENQLLRSGDQGLSDIKERTTYVAEQLSSATKTAESSLKQLLSGVDNLKLLSQVLTSIDRISENKSPENQDNHKKTFDDT